MRAIFLLLLSLALFACNPAVGPADSGAPPDAGAPDSGTPDGGSAGATFTLTITNYLDWCGITENGAAFSTSKSFASGSVVQLQGSPLTGFVWGYWTGTDADTGAHDVSMAATVTMTADKTVLACCPVSAGQTCP